MELCQVIFCFFPENLTLTKNQTIFRNSQKLYIPLKKTPQDAIKIFPGWVFIFIFFYVKSIPRASIGRESIYNPRCLFF